MASISLRRDVEPSTSMMSQLPEPFRAMRELLGWDPLRSFEPVRDLLAMPMQRAALNEFSPDFEVKETKDGFVIKADVAGVKEGDIDVSVSGDRITVSGKREDEARDSGDTWYTYERTYGAFTRTFRLPTGIDLSHAHADLKNGVLSIALPKKEQTPVQKIQIKSGEKGKA